MTKDELLKLAHDAIGAYMAATDSEEDAKAHSLMAEAFFKIKEALAQPEQELVALLKALEAAREWIGAAPHGDNCFLHDDGEYNRCFCGKDSIENYIDGVLENTTPPQPKEPEQEPELGGHDVLFPVGITRPTAEEVSRKPEQVWVEGYGENSSGFVKAQPEQEPVAWEKEYSVINAFYGSRVALRSQLLLMRHIDDGLHILQLIGASALAKAAFCLHPIVQNNEAVNVSWSPAYQLACEYRDKANAYLCRPDTDWVTTSEDVRFVVGDMSNDCRAMLIADKRQNYGDFITAHFGKHVRSQQLDRYFRLWLSFLEGTPPPQRKPLSDEQIGEIGRKYEKFDNQGNEFFARWGFARAIEAAHGIKE